MMVVSGRAQLVGDAAYELPLQPLGLGQGRFAIAQGALQAARIGDVGEADQGRPVGQGARLPGDDPPVGGRDLVCRPGPGPWDRGR